MPKRAVVLAGGGSRGPYQVGVWQALRELDIPFQIVTGTSVGALNGALMAQGDFAQAKEMWESLAQSDVIAAFSSADPSGLVGKGRYFGDFIKQLLEQGGLDVSPLEATLRRAVDEQALRASPVEYGLVTAKLPAFKAVQLTKSEIPEGELVDYMLASATYFPFFPRKEIGGDRYVDGAFSDNLPIELALRCGAEEIVAVDLHSIGRLHRPGGGVPITYIHCHWDLGQVLAFDKAFARRNLRLGYLDGLRAYHRLEGCAYAFSPGESGKNARALAGALSFMRYEMGVWPFGQQEKLPALLNPPRPHERWFAKGGESPTLGRAVATAAEIAGELLELPPEPVYAFRDFNALLAATAEYLRRPRGEQASPNPFESPGRLKTRLALQAVYDLLVSAEKSGSPPETLWALAALTPKEFVAANYLYALELLARESEWGPAARL